MHEALNERINDLQVQVNKLRKEQKKITEAIVSHLQSPLHHTHEHSHDGNAVPHHHMKHDTGIA